MANGETGNGRQPNPKLGDDFRQPQMAILSWTDTDADDALEDLHQHARKVGQDAIDWYIIHKRSKSWFARTLRVLAIALTGMGGAIPLLVTAGLIQGQGSAGVTEISFGSLGYLFLAAAGTCVALDRFFGFSSGWIRYVTTSMTLQRMLADFDFDWARLNSALAGQEATPAGRAQRLELLQAFVHKVLAEVEAETAAWAAEFRTSLTDIDKAAEHHTKSWTPGAIVVVVPHAPRTPDGVAINLNGQQHRIVRANSCQFSPVFPGNHQVTATWQVNGSPTSLSRSVHLAAGETATIEFDGQT